MRDGNHVGKAEQRHSVDRRPTRTCPQGPPARGPTPGPAPLASCSLETVLRGGGASPGRGANGTHASKPRPLLLLLLPNRFENCSTARGFGRRLLLGLRGRSRPSPAWGLQAAPLGGATKVRGVICISLTPHNLWGGTCGPRRSGGADTDNGNEKAAPAAACVSVLLCFRRRSSHVRGAGRDGIRPPRTRCDPAG